MKKLFALFCIAVMSVATFAKPNPCSSVRGANDEVCASYSYGCSGSSTMLDFSVSLENGPSRGTTVVKIQLTTDDGQCLYKTVYIEKGQYTAYVSVNVGQYVCAKIEIIGAYVQ